MSTPRDVVNKYKVLWCALILIVIGISVLITFLQKPKYQVYVYANLKTDIPYAQLLKDNNLLYDRIKGVEYEVDKGKRGSSGRYLYKISCISRDKENAILGLKKWLMAYVKWIPGSAKIDKVRIVKLEAKRKIIFIQYNIIGIGLILFGTIMFESLRTWYDTPLMGGE